MTLEEARRFIEAIVLLRERAANADALEARAAYPVWRAGAAYVSGQRVRHGDVLYSVLMDHTSQADWPPDTAVSLFARVLLPEDGTTPEWEQPGSENGYMKGDRVIHNGIIWISDSDANIWEPGVYGWTEEAL